MPDDNQLMREAALWLLELRLGRGIERTQEERNAAFIVWVLRSPGHVKAFLMASAFCSNVESLLTAE